MHKSVAKRIRFTKTGKMIRRKMGVDHFRVRKSKHQKSAQKHSYSLATVDRKSFIRQMNRIG